MSSWSTKWSSWVTDAEKERPHGRSRRRQQTDAGNGLDQQPDGPSGRPGRRSEHHDRQRSAGQQPDPADPRPELTDGQQRPADHSRRHSLLGRTGRPRPEHHREHVGAERRVGRGHLRFARLERRHPDQTKRGSQGEFHVTTKQSSPSPSRCSASKPWVPTSSSASNRTWAGSRTIKRRTARSAGRFDYQRQREGKLRQGHHQRLAGLRLPHGLHDGPPAELPGRQREDHLYGLGFLPGQPRRGLQFELPAHERLCQHQPENERLAVRRSHHAVREP